MDTTKLNQIHAEAEQARATVQSLSDERRQLLFERKRLEAHAAEMKQSGFDLPAHERERLAEIEALMPEIDRRYQDAHRIFVDAYALSERCEQYARGQISGR